MTVNPKDETMQMVSIPRDTRTQIIGRGTLDKINHSYAFGGTKMAMDTVENFLDIDLDHYIKMNMEGLTAMIDAVGGVTVDNDLEWQSNGYHYPKGKLDLENGKKALGYVRMRHQDPDGDFGRNDRQRQVIQAVIDKAANFSSFSRYDNILEAIGGNVKTDITFEEMKSIAKNDRKARHHMKTYEVKGDGTRIDDIYYLLVSDAEREKVHAMIKEQL
jgi:LCP family protein required for cell wall assembly